MKKPYQAPTVKKAFNILRLLSEHEKGLGISDMARALDMSKGTVSGIAAGLEETGAIKRDPVSKRFFLGLTLLELGRASFGQATMSNRIRPVLEDLMERVDESVFFGAKRGDRVTIIDVVESHQDVKISSSAGTTIPLVVGATGKVFLSLMERQRAKKVIQEKGLTRYTKNTIIDPEKYLEELEKVRAQGYATDYEEYLSGVRSVVCPVGGLIRFSIALWVTGFKTSLDDEKMALAIDETKRAAHEISTLFARS
jgi:DNA-binding IclR family transcriptional regulator